MDALHDAAAPGYELLLKADFLRLIALLLPCCSAADEDTRLHMEYTAKLKTVLEYIDAHYAEELSIADLASLCYFSEYHFMRFFKRFMGTSCLNYIKNLRLEKAAELLGQDGLTPLDASLSAGFHNLSYFYREFRKKYGVTPGISAEPVPGRNRLYNRKYHSGAKQRDGVFETKCKRFLPCRFRQFIPCLCHA